MSRARWGALVLVVLGAVVLGVVVLISGRTSDGARDPATAPSLPVPVSGGPSPAVVSPSRTTTPSPSASGRAVPVDTFGSGCGAVDAVLRGSAWRRISRTARVSSALADLPGTAVYVGALQRAQLDDALDDASALTVFVPTDDAFAAVSAGERRHLLADPGALTLVLSHGILPENLGRDHVLGPHPTLAGSTISVTGSGDHLSVNGAKVICGGITTANATIYLVDSLLGAS